MNLNDVIARPGAGMDSELHEHAKRAALIADESKCMDPIEAYVLAARHWCPECGSQEPAMSNQAARLVDRAYCCDACGHQWSPLEG